MSVSLASIGGCQTPTALAVRSTAPEGSRSLARRRGLMSTLRAVAVAAAFVASSGCVTTRRGGGTSVLGTSTSSSIREIPGEKIGPDARKIVGYTTSDGQWHVCPNCTVRSVGEDQLQISVPRRL